jgi:hypothetical protein
MGAFHVTAQPIAGSLARECIMKLQLLTAGVVAYTVLTMAWICYAELMLP